jgi:Sulfotransferase family
MPVRVMNAVGNGCSRLGLDGMRLHAEGMCREAVRRTGLSDFGDESFRPALEILVDSIQREAHLHMVGRHLIRQQIIGRLAARLQMQAYWASRPQALEQPIARPLFVLGLPRTGTTLLFYLLAQDPAHRWLSNWEAHNPLPRDSEPDQRRLRAVKSNRLLNWLAPDLRRKHAVAADNPAECIHLQMMTFESEYFPFAVDVPGYRTWLYRRDRVSGYRHYRNQLCVLQDQRWGERWLLKTPFHIFSLDALLAVFPDACIVQTHRDPLEALASTCSLQATLRDLYADKIDCAQLGRDVLEHFAYGMDRCMDARAKVPARHFHDVNYRALVRDPVAVVEGIYRHFGFDLTQDARARMRAFLANNPQHKNGMHRYSLADFGLDAESASTRFKRYTDQFLIPSSGNVISVGHNTT